jgi:sarcosine oxidase subunit beta
VKDVLFEKRMWRPPAELRPYYEVVIVGGGTHGLATAYYLGAYYGMKNVAVLEKSYIGSGAAAPSAAIVRPNDRTPAGVTFYEESGQLYEGLSQDIGFNVVFSQHGHLTLAHSDRELITAQERAELDQVLGVDSRVVGVEEIRELCPPLDVSDLPSRPVVGALFHRSGGVIRHDAVVWGLARGADRVGIEIHPRTEATGFERQGDRVLSVNTNRGRVACGSVVVAVGGQSSVVAERARVRLPISTHLLQAFVTEPLKPFLDIVIVSPQLHVSVSQTDTGEFLIGTEIEPSTTYDGTGTFSLLEDSARHALELFPQLERVKVLRSWAGLCDLSPDSRPVLGRTEIENLHLSAGWGTNGIGAAPIVGVTLAELTATGRTPDLIAPFALERFHADTPVSEPAAAAVSH